MLSGLYIKNVAVIKELSIDFEKGFTVLTGETGAGKSIIIDAIHAVLGQRVSKDLIRTDEDKAIITAFFTELDQSVLDILQSLDIEVTSDEMQIYRELRSSGKSICKINSVPITATMLKSIGVHLISIQGQHDSYELTFPEIHGKYLDNYGNLNEELSNYQHNYNKLKVIKKEIDKLNIDQIQKERRIDFLQYQISEISEAQIQVGEKEQLNQKLKIIKDKESISHAIKTSKEVINGDDDTEGVLGMINHACAQLEDVEPSFPDIRSVSNKLRDIEYSLQDISNELRNIESRTDYDGENLTEIEERLNLLYRLSLKYGENEEDILDLLESSSKELENIRFSDEKILELTEEFELTKNKTVELAKQLSKKRKFFALEFSKKVKEELEFLNMPNVEFSVDLERTNLYSFGCDKVSFLVSVNAGESLKQLSKVASGGELSRIMLAIKTVLSSGDNIDTMIFDEIDAGISGDTANRVGKKLLQVSKSKQLLCITHLAQIAAIADNHLLIQKNSSDGKTYTTIKELSEVERKKELSKIIGGDEIATYIIGN